MAVVAPEVHLALGSGEILRPFSIFAQLPLTETTADIPNLRN